MDKSHNEGFTLIELMITVAVLALILAISVPSFSGVLERRQLQGAGEKLFADFMLAKTEAIKRNSNVTVSFKINSPNWCYGLVLGNASCDCAAADCVIDGVTYVTSQEDFDRVTVLAGESALAAEGAIVSTTFSPLRGAPDASGDLEFSVSSGANLGVNLPSTAVGKISICSDGGFNFDPCP